MYASVPGDTLWKNNDQLDKPGPALAAIRKTLIAFAERSDLSSAEGCTGLNAVSEFGQRDADVTRIGKVASQAQNQALMRVLIRAKSLESGSAARFEPAKLREGTASIWASFRCCSPIQR